MESQYELFLGDTKIVLQGMLDRGEKVDMIFT